jgi:hypothetical protein
MSDLRRREFHEALLEADAFEDLAGKWQAARNGRTYGSSAANSSEQLLIPAPTGAGCSFAWWLLRKALCCVCRAG